MEDGNVSDCQRRPYQHQSDGPAWSAGPLGNVGVHWRDRRRRINRDGVVSFCHGCVSPRSTGLDEFPASGTNATAPAEDVSDSQSARSLVLAECFDVDPSATSRLNVRERRADLAEQVREEEEHGIWMVCDEPLRADDRDVCAGHPQALLGGRGVGHRRQQRPVHSRLAQQDNRPRGGAIPKDGAPL